MLSFDKIVKKLWNKWWKVIFRDDIFEMIDPEKKPEYVTLVNKTIYRLKSQGSIISLRNGVYIVREKWDETLNEIDLLEKYYFILVKRYIMSVTGGEYFITWKKALEFHFKNYGIPSKVFILNRKVNKKVMIGDYEMIFKTISSKGKNLFSKCYQHTKHIEVWWVWFRISGLELALVEASLVSEVGEWIDVGLITQTIKKYEKYFDTKVFYLLWEYKYIMAFNRLKELSKNISPKLHEIFLDIIKKNGGLFIGEGKRRL